jgi:uncharacterized protein
MFVGLIITLSITLCYSNALEIGGARGQQSRRHVGNLPLPMKRNHDQRPMQFSGDGCLHGGAANREVCLNDLNGKESSDTHFQMQPMTVSYQPGNFSEGRRSDDNNLILSNGLAAKPIAHSGQFVNYTSGATSEIYFHDSPDAAGVFPKDDGGWYYVSNCENKTRGEEWWNGGVGSIEFDRDGNLIHYGRVATQTRMNCGGGKTPWKSWVSCEEIDEGEIYQVDPSGSRDPVKTDLGSFGHYESFAYDDSPDAFRPTFYVTRDSSRGSLTRFTPNSIGMECYNQANDYDRWCTLNHGTRDYLLISGGPKGTFTWTTNETAARNNAQLYYPNSEGIDVNNGILYTTSKKLKRLMILDLRSMTYTYESTKGGAFDEQPDQVARIVKNEPNSILYFCEDGGRNIHSPGVFGRNVQGEYFAIIQGTFLHKDETTGLAFSPDGYHMYVSYQKVGIVYDIWRLDGYSFQGAMLDIKYHTMTIETE